MSHVYIILGEPGAGKDTQADLLAAQTGGIVIKTGQLARAAAATNRDIDAALKAGELASDDLINELVESTLQTALTADVIIFDGYPRHTGQAAWLDRRLQQVERHVDRVFAIQLSQTTAFERLARRQRRDDETAIITRRLQVFDEATRPVEAYYGQQGKLVEIDGEGNVAAVQAAIKAALL